MRAEGGLLVTVSRLVCGVLVAGAIVAAGARPAGAHAILVRSSVRDRPVAPDAPSSVTLQFNAGIEPKLSKVLLVNGRHEEQPLTVGPGATAGELKVDLPALSAGTYALRYRVLAADGHLTDAMLRFTVSPAH